MTVDRLAQGVRPPEHEETDPEQSPDRQGAATPERTGLSPSTILGMCDRLLGEVGRRRHMFAWLRDPGSSAGDWLPVDAYYPRARLVVMCRSGRGPHDAHYRELVPAHGLGLLTLDPGLMGDDEAAVEAALAARIFDLEHVPRPAPVEARPAAKTPAIDVPASSWTPVKVERAPVAPALEQGVGLLVGLSLAVILIVEVYLGVVEVAFGAGRLMLGFAIAVEACSRALGTVAAARAGERAWACGCAIGGAPVVAWFAFGRRTGRQAVEPAPLAGLLAGLAAVVAILALLFGT